MGVVLGIILNMLPIVSWEVATLIEIVACLLIYYYPALLRRRENPGKDVDDFFRLLEAPIKEENKPLISPQYIRALVYLFVFSMVASGIMFTSMSFPSLDTKGGQYGLVAGILCLAAAVVIFVMYKYRLKKKAL